jgi:hypothetical protein
MADALTYLREPDPFLRVTQEVLIVPMEEEAIRLRGLLFEED